MNTGNCIDAVDYIDALKNTVDELWNRHGKNQPLDTLVYSSDGYGAMQREELKEILSLIEKVKTNVSDLYDNCLSIDDEDCAI